MTHCFDVLIWNYCNSEVAGDFNFRAVTIWVARMIYKSRNISRTLRINEAIWSQLEKIEILSTSDRLTSCLFFLVDDLANVLYHDSLFWDVCCTNCSTSTIDCVNHLECRKVSSGQLLVLASIAGWTGFSITLFPAFNVNAIAGTTAWINIRRFAATRVSIEFVVFQQLHGRDRKIRVDFNEGITANSRANCIISG